MGQPNRNTLTRSRTPSRQYPHRLLQKSFLLVAPVFCSVPNPDAISLSKPSYPIDPLRPDCLKRARFCVRQGLDIRPSHTQIWRRQSLGLCVDMILASSRGFWRSNHKLCSVCCCRCRYYCNPWQRLMEFDGDWKAVARWPREVE